MYTRDSAQISFSDLDANYQVQREQILGFLQPKSVNTVGILIYQAEITALHQAMDSFYKRNFDRKKDGSEMLDFFVRLQSCIWQILHGNQFDGEHLLEELAEFFLHEEDEANRFALMKIQRLLQLLVNEQVQTIIVANIYFNQSLEINHEHIKHRGKHLLNALQDFKTNSPLDKATMIEVLQRSSNLLEKPLETIKSYQHYANRVEGRTSMAYKILGHTMKVVGVGIYAVGFGGLVISASTLLPSASASCITLMGSMVVMMIGFGTWLQGRSLVEKNTPTKLSQKMGLFAQAVNKYQTSSSRGVGSDSDEDAFPLISLGRGRDSFA